MTCLVPSGVALDRVSVPDDRLQRGPRGERGALTECAGWALTERRVLV